MLLAHERSWRKTQGRPNIVGIALGSPDRVRARHSDSDPRDVSADSRLGRDGRGDLLPQRAPGDRVCLGGVRMRRPPRAGSRRDGPEVRGEDPRDRALPDRRGCASREHPRRVDRVTDRVGGAGGQRGSRRGVRGHARRFRRAADSPEFGAVAKPGPGPAAPWDQHHSHRLQHDPSVPDGRRPRSPRDARDRPGATTRHAHRGVHRPGDRADLRRRRDLHRELLSSVHRAFRLSRGVPRGGVPDPPARRRRPHRPTRR